MTGWAVVDVETTGLNVARDRVVEIAIVRLDEHGHQVDEWSTLVNPDGRNPGRVHGIRKADVEAAPTFRLVVHDVLSRLSDHVIVAHNAPFDVGFLHAEAARAGVAWGPVEGFCTMEVLYELGMAKGRDLHTCCADLGVATGREHVAIDDARAVAGLMAYLGPRLWSIDAPAPAPRWSGPSSPIPVVNRPPSAAGESPAKRLPGIRIPPDLGVAEAAASTYLGLLDLIVEDGEVTDNEVEALHLFARAIGLHRQVARRLHQAYLDEMARVAADDGIVTGEERAHLARLTGLLSRALPR